MSLMENTLRDSCSARISDGAPGLGGDNLAVTTLGRIRFFSIAAWIVPAFRPAPWNTFYFTRCCTSSTRLDGRAAAWSLIRGNFAKKRSAFANSNTRGASWTGWRTDLTGVSLDLVRLDSAGTILALSS